MSNEVSLLTVEKSLPSSAFIRQNDITPLGNGLGLAVARREDERLVETLEALPKMDAALDDFETVLEINLQELQKTNSNLAILYNGLDMHHAFAYSPDFRWETSSHSRQNRRSEWRI